MSGIVEEIRKALDAATPGPWEAINIGMPSGAVWRVDACRYTVATAISEENAYLIANAPTWLRTLLEENRKLEGMFDDANRRAAVSKVSIDELHAELQQLREELERCGEKLETQERLANKYATDYAELERHHQHWCKESDATLEQVKKERDELRDEFIRTHEAAQNWCQAAEGWKGKYEELEFSVMRGEEYEPLRSQLAEKDKVQVRMNEEIEALREYIGRHAACGSVDARQLLTKYTEVYPILSKYDKYEEEETK